MYLNKLNATGNELSTLRMQLSEMEGKVSGFDSRLNGLPARISQLRKMNYRILTHMEKDQASLTERWAAVGPGLRDIVNSGAAMLRPELASIEAELNQRRMDPSNNMARLSGLDLRISTLRLKVSDLAGRVSGAMGGIDGTLQNLEQDIGVAEKTVSLSSQASFPWKEGESLVLSVNAEDEDNDVDGVLTLTNQRFLYESEKEVVLKKTLFIATQKKKVRELVIDKPIGVVGKITKGRVGLLAGAGLYVEFKPESSLKGLKLDTKGPEADMVIRFYNMIVSGDVDSELHATQGTTETKAKPEALMCPRCGAPYTDEIYRGQTSMQCRYCGTAIPIPQ